MDTIYRKVEIKSKDDLPKEDKDYIVHSKSFGWIGLANWKTFENANYPEYNQYLWLLNYDWYLQPIEPEEEPNPTSWGDFTMTDDIEPQEPDKESQTKYNPLYQLANNQTDMPEEFQEIVNKEFFNLIDSPEIQSKSIEFIAGEIIRICDEFVSFDNKCIAVKQKLYSLFSQGEKVTDEEIKKWVEGKAKLGNPFGGYVLDMGGAHWLIEGAKAMRDGRIPGIGETISK